MSNRLLAIAPHPDDETLGCGGTLLKARERGAQIGWLIMTEMDKKAGYSSERIARREAQIEQVANHYQFDLVRRSGLPAACLDSVPRNDIVASISRTVTEFEPDVLLVPYPGDVHSDHRIVFEAAQACAKWFRHDSIRRVLCYETPSETGFGLDPADHGFRPNWYEDIAPHLHGKLAALALFTDEIGEFPFPRSSETVKALARLRGSEAGYDAAEAFMLLRERRD